MVKTTVRQVNSGFVQTIWPKIDGMIRKAMEHSAGEYNTDQLKVLLVQGLQILLVADDGEKIHGAATVSFIDYPNDKIAFVTSIGGKMLANKDIWQQFETWCRAHGCTKVQGAAFDAVARLWKRQFGTEICYYIVEKKL